MAVKKKRELENTSHKSVLLSGAHFPDCEEDAGGFRQEGIHCQPRPRPLP